MFAYSHKFGSRFRCCCCYLFHYGLWVGFVFISFYFRLSVALCLSSILCNRFFVCICGNQYVHLPFIFDDCFIVQLKNTKIACVYNNTLLIANFIQNTNGIFAFFNVDKELNSKLYVQYPLIVLIAVEKRIGEKKKKLNDYPDLFKRGNWKSEIFPFVMIFGLHFHL